MVTGDGDALSIGGNHLIHALRRNMNLTILLFNNRIYGLTKGQYSPTSEVGKVTKSTPMGSLDYPFNPVSLALGAEATFVGRALDSDRKGLTEVLRGAAAHRGAALVEILQDCPIFNDGSFDALRKEGAEERLINVSHGEPITFGADGEYCVVKSGYGLEVAKTADVSADEIVVHNAQFEDPAYAFALSRLSEQNLEHMVMGIFRQVSKPTYDDAARTQVARRARPSRTTRPHCSRCFAARTPGPSTNLTDVTSSVPLRRSRAGRRGIPAGWAATRPLCRVTKATRRSSSTPCRRCEPAVCARIRDRRAGTAAAQRRGRGTARRGSWRRATAGDGRGPAGGRRGRAGAGIRVCRGHAAARRRR